MTSVLPAQAVFVLEHTDTHKLADTTEYPNHTTAWVLTTGLEIRAVTYE